MSDILSRLVARAQGSAICLAHRVRYRFAPADAPVGVWSGRLGDDAPAEPLATGTGVERPAQPRAIDRGAEPGAMPGPVQVGPDDPHQVRLTPRQPDATVVMAPSGAFEAPASLEGKPAPATGRRTSPHGASPAARGGGPAPSAQTALQPAVQRVAGAAAPSETTAFPAGAEQAMPSATAIGAEDRASRKASEPREKSAAAKPMSGPTSDLAAPKAIPRTSPIAGSPIERATAPVAQLRAESVFARPTAGAGGARSGSADVGTFPSTQAIGPGMPAENTYRSPAAHAGGAPEPRQFERQPVLPAASVEPAPARVTLETPLSTDVGTSPSTPAASPGMAAEPSRRPAAAQRFERLPTTPAASAGPTPAQAALETPPPADVGTFPPAPAASPGMAAEPSRRLAAAQRFERLPMKPVASAGPTPAQATLETPPPADVGTFPPAPAASRGMAAEPSHRSPAVQRFERLPAKPVASAGPTSARATRETPSSTDVGIFPPGPAAGPGMAVERSHRSSAERAGGFSEASWFERQPILPAAAAGSTRAWAALETPSPDDAGTLPRAPAAGPKMAVEPSHRSSPAQRFERQLEKPAAQAEPTSARGKLDSLPPAPAAGPEVSHQSPAERAHGAPDAWKFERRPTKPLTGAGPTPAGPRIEQASPARRGAHAPAADRVVSSPAGAGHPKALGRHGSGWSPSLSEQFPPFSDRGGSRPEPSRPAAPPPPAPDEIHIDIGRIQIELPRTQTPRTQRMPPGPPPLRGKPRGGPDG